MNFYPVADDIILIFDARDVIGHELANDRIGLSARGGEAEKGNDERNKSGGMHANGGKMHRIQHVPRRNRSSARFPIRSGLLAFPAFWRK